MDLVPSFESFRCTRCGGTVREALAQRCPGCGGILEARYVGEGRRRLLEWTDEQSLWAFRSSLPIRPPTYAITRGEGRTPLEAAPDLATTLGIELLWLKIESVNPTGSFKDRALSIAMTYALEHRASGVIGSSSGNALHAQAAYAARAGLRSIALVPENVPTSRLVQPIVCGTRVVRVRGDYSDCHRFALELAQRTGWYNTSTTYENPICVEGYKTISY